MRRRTPLKRKSWLRPKKPWRFQEKEWGADKPPKRKKLRRISKNRAEQEAVYRIARVKFLDREENQWCPVMREIFSEEQRAEQVHHKAGRQGKLLNDVGHWLAVSAEGHRWIHDNPAAAMAKGWIEIRGK